ncbi:MAG: alpha/beta hydrolase family protein, partial [Myxococcota bacterium]
MRRLTDRLHTLTGRPSWTQDGQAVLCRLVPEGRGEEPIAARVPGGPNVQVTDGTKSPLRTYQDLLANEHDADTWEFYATSELVILSLDGGEPQALGKGIFSSASLSHDGEWLMTTRIERPYSFLMPYYLFPQRVEVALVTAPGAAVLAWDIPAAEGVPIGGVRTGARSFQWAASQPATLYWAEALDGGDPKAEVEHRDRWLVASAPFTTSDDGEPSGEEFVRLEYRASGLTFFDDPALVATGEYDRDRRWRRTLLHEIGSAGEALVLEDRSSNDRYGDPGTLVMHNGARGARVVRQDGDWVYRTGRGASAQGDLPFLRRHNLRTQASEEIWRCSPDAYESVVAMMPGGPAEKPVFVTQHETKISPPNYFLNGDERVALTSFDDPQPKLRGITKQRVTYEREDGIPLSATLYLPADYEEGTRLPMLVWGYPREYNDPRTAGQISGSTNRFTRLAGTSHLFLVTQGYAVLDGATMPIIGDAETMNDTFVTQLVGSAQAAIDVAVEMGVADRDRVGVAGHSYGAFMTAHLLAHTDLFAGGIARSGAYNRTLTPFGFQGEQRNFWQAQETYMEISPFTHAG